MVKYSILIPLYGKLVDNNLSHCLEALSIQNYKNFEVIICGIKVLPQEDQMINGIRFRNIIVLGSEINRSFGKLMNIAVKEANGDYLQLWSMDLLCYEDYIKKLNFYVDSYGEDVLYTCTQFIMRKDNEPHHDFFVKSPTFADGLHCMHKKHYEPFVEEYIGYGGGGEEWLYRIWRRVTFICLNIPVVHIPHFNRTSQEIINEEGRIGAILTEKLRALNFDYERYPKV